MSEYSEIRETRVQSKIETLTTTAPKIRDLEIKDYGMIIGTVTMIGVLLYYHAKRTLEYYDKKY